MILEGIRYASQTLRERPSCLIIILQKKDSYIIKILLRFDDVLIKSMKEAKPTEYNHLS